MFSFTNLKIVTLVLNQRAVFYLPHRFALIIRRRNTNLSYVISIKYISSWYLISRSYTFNVILPTLPSLIVIKLLKVFQSRAAIFYYFYFWITVTLTAVVLTTSSSTRAQLLSYDGWLEDNASTY
jgi:hypothetical protein